MVGPTLATLAKDSNTKVHNGGRKKKDGGWKESKEKAFLVSMLMDPESDIHEMSTKEIFTKWSDFQTDGYKKFSDRLRRLNKACRNDLARCLNERGKFNKFKESSLKNPFPMEKKTDWQNHPAKARLERDIESGRAYELKPEQLWKRRGVYHDNFDLKTFRKHVLDLKGKKLAVKYWAAKRNRFGKANKWCDEIKIMREKWNS